jgi:hypothetical protein
MQDYNLYEYAVIRVVPRVEREEFINIGVVLYCAKKKFLEVRFVVNEPKLKMLCADLEIDELQEHLKIFECICQGNKCNSPIAALDLPSRFRWLTATRSTILQSSKVHPGFCIHPDEKLNQLLAQMVG